MSGEFGTGVKTGCREIVRIGREPRGSSRKGEGEDSWDSWKAIPCFLFFWAISPPSCVGLSCIGGGVRVCGVPAPETTMPTFIVVRERESVYPGHVQV